MGIHSHHYHMPDCNSTYCNKDWSQHEDNSAHHCCNIRPLQPTKTQQDYMVCITDKPHIIRTVVLLLKNYKA